MYKFAKKVANHEGFTLVELIVVIAILGILAGIAIPVYSGYIKKANQAADVMLLGAVNTAVAAACAENDFAKLGDDAKLIVESKKITGIDPGTKITTTLAESEEAAAASATLVQDIKDSFLNYFGDNKNTVLKYATDASAFEFNKTEQTFSIKGVGGGNSGSILDGLTEEQVASINATAEQVRTALSGSSYEGVEATLLTDVQSLTTAVQDIPESILNGMLGGAFGDYLREKGVDTSDQVTVANYASLFVANQVSNLTDAQKAKIKELWTNNTFYYGDDASSIAEGVKLYMDEGTGLSTVGAMALYYANAEAAIQHMNATYNPTDAAKIAQKQAVITAFQGVAENMKNAQNPADIWNAIQTGYSGMIAAAFDNEDLVDSLFSYGAANKGADVDAFIGAMSAINANESNLSALTEYADMYTQIAAIFG